WFPPVECDTQTLRAAMAYHLGPICPCLYGPIGPRPASTTERYVRSASQYVRGQEASRRLGARSPRLFPSLTVTDPAGPAWLPGAASWDDHPAASPCNVCFSGIHVRVASARVERLARPGQIHSESPSPPTPILAAAHPGSPGTTLTDP